MYCTVYMYICIKSIVTSVGFLSCGRVEGGEGVEIVCVFS